MLADADDGIRAVRAGVLHHQFQRLLSRGLAHFLEKSDVAAHERFQRSADGPEYAARAHGDSAHQTYVPHHAVSRQLKRRGNHVFVYAYVHRSPFVLLVLTSLRNLTCASRASQSWFVEGYAFV